MQKKRALQRHEHLTCRQVAAALLGCGYLAFGRFGVPASSRWTSVCNASMHSRSDAWCIPGGNATPQLGQSGNGSVSRRPQRVCARRS